MISTHCRGPGYPVLYHLQHLERQEREQRFGRGTVEPLGPLDVGVFTTLTFTFEIGHQGVAQGGHLGVCWRWPYDWNDLQACDPGATAT